MKRIFRVAPESFLVRRGNVVVADVEVVEGLDGVVSVAGPRVEAASSRGLSLPGFHINAVTCLYVSGKDNL